MNNGRDPKIEGLIAGWAAGTLTADEQTALMQAALEDQALFDELASMEPLREAFADHATRSRLLDALEPPVPWYRRRWTWAAAAVPVLAGVVWLVMIPWINSLENRAVYMAKAPAPAQAPPLEMRTKWREPAAPAAGRLPKETVAPARNDVPKETGARAKTVAAPPAAEVLADEPKPVPAVEKAEGRFAEARPTPDLPEAKRQEERAAAVAAAPPAVPALTPSARTGAPAAGRMDLQTGTTLTLLAIDTADSLWKPLPDQSVAPAGTPLRLRVITSTRGLVQIQPGNHRLAVRQAGQAVEIDLGSYEPGEQTLEASLTPMPAGLSGANETGMPANRFRAAENAKQESTALMQTRQASGPKLGAANPAVTKLHFRVR